MSTGNPQNEYEAIPVRSHKQAMDWSLALISQGVESEIKQVEDGWELRVTPGTRARAEGVLATYQAENRGWGWRPKLVTTGRVFHRGSVLWVFVLGWIFIWSEGRLGRLEKIAFMDNTAVQAGQWWRLFTAITLHADYSHLAANISTGWLLLGLAMARYGAGFGLLASYLAGAVGNLAGYWIYDGNHLGLGASGMVMGALGLISVQPLPGLEAWSLMARFFLRSLATGACMLLLMGTSPGSDLLAHAGGFVGGVLFGFALNWGPESWRQGWPDKLCLVGLVVFVLWTWRLALG